MIAIRSLRQRSEPPATSWWSSPRVLTAIREPLVLDHTRAKAETWLPVPGWEGFYEVSDLGQVRSVDRSVTIGNGRMRRYSGKILSPGIHPKGYLFVILSRPGHKQVVLVHRLVLSAFRGPCPPGHEGCHWDNDRANEALPNLRWDTHGNNELDKRRHGTHKRCSRGR